MNALFRERQVTLEDQLLRDGLQMESRIFSLDEKIRLFGMLVDAGVKRIQVGSFVGYAAVPQMADTEELVRNLGVPSGVLVSALVLNEKGLERALACGIKHVTMSVSASDAHSRKNVKRSAVEALSCMKVLVTRAVQSGLVVRAGVQCAFGCGYEGIVPEERVLEAAASLARAGAMEINLADTAGMANPWQVKRLTSMLHEALPGVRLSLHLHDTRGLGLANMLAGFEKGIELFDVSTGGLGGVPLSKGPEGISRPRMPSICLRRWA